MARLADGLAKLPAKPSRHRCRFDGFHSRHGAIAKGRGAFARRVCCVARLDTHMRAQCMNNCAMMRRIHNQLWRLLHEMKARWGMPPTGRAVNRRGANTSYFDRAQSGAFNRGRASEKLPIPGSTRPKTCPYDRLRPPTRAPRPVPLRWPCAVCWKRLQNCGAGDTDRRLARRVAVELRRWNIEVDDSAGRALATTPLAQFMRLVNDMCVRNFAPVPLWPC